MHGHVSQDVGGHRWGGRLRWRAQTAWQSQPRGRFRDDSRIATCCYEILSNISRSITFDKEKSSCDWRIPIGSRLGKSKGLRARTYPKKHYNADLTMIKRCPNGPDKHQNRDGWHRHGSWWKPTRKFHECWNLPKSQPFSQRNLFTNYFFPHIQRYIHIYIYVCGSRHGSPSGMVPQPGWRMLVKHTENEGFWARRLQNVRI